MEGELSRLSRANDRLLRMITLQDQAHWEDVDLGRLLNQVAARWGAVAERTWQVDVVPGACRLSPEHLRVCLDTLIENALRYTGPGDVVRLCARPIDGWTLVVPRKAALSS